jgi:hypothetical protein
MLPGCVLKYHAVSIWIFGSTFVLPTGGAEDLDPSAQRDTRFSTGLRAAPARAARSQAVFYYCFLQVPTKGLAMSSSVVVAGEVRKSS